MVVDCGTDYIEVAWGELPPGMFILRIDPMDGSKDQDNDIRIARFEGTELRKILHNHLDVRNSYDNS